MCNLEVLIPVCKMIQISFDTLFRPAIHDTPAAETVYCSTCMDVITYITSPVLIPIQET